MPKLIYAFLASLDGYIADDAGGFEWAVPDEEVHGFINALERDVGTYLYGRNMYEVMTSWENDPWKLSQWARSERRQMIAQPRARTSMRSPSPTGVAS